MNWLHASVFSLKIVRFGHKWFDSILSLNQLERDKLNFKPVYCVKYVQFNSLEFGIMDVDSMFG